MALNPLSGNAAINTQDRPVIQLASSDVKSGRRRDILRLAKKVRLMPMPRSGLSGLVSILSGLTDIRTSFQAAKDSGSQLPEP